VKANVRLAIIFIVLPIIVGLIMNYFYLTSLAIVCLVYACGNFAIACYTNSGKKESYGQKPTTT
jgi:hypothetical protein